MLLQKLRLFFLSSNNCSWDDFGGECLPDSEAEDDTADEETETDEETEGESDEDIDEETDIDEPDEEDSDTVIEVWK